MVHAFTVHVCMVIMRGDIGFQSQPLLRVKRTSSMRKPKKKVPSALKKRWQSLLQHTRSSNSSKLFVWTSNDEGRLRGI